MVLCYIRVLSPPCAKPNHIMGLRDGMGSPFSSLPPYLFSGKDYTKLLSSQILFPLPTWASATAPSFCLPHFPCTTLEIFFFAVASKGFPARFVFSPRFEIFGISPAPVPFTPKTPAEEETRGRFNYRIEGRENPIFFPHTATKLDKSTNNPTATLLLFSSFDSLPRRRFKCPEVLSFSQKIIMKERKYKRGFTHMNFAQKGLLLSIFFAFFRGARIFLRWQFTFLFGATPFFAPFKSPESFCLRGKTRGKRWNGSISLSGFGGGERRRVLAPLKSRRNIRSRYTYTHTAEPEKKVLNTGCWKNMLLKQPLLGFPFLKQPTTWCFNFEISVCREFGGDSNFPPPLFFLVFRAPLARRRLLRKKHR